MRVFNPLGGNERFLLGPANEARDSKSHGPDKAIFGDTMGEVIAALEYGE